MPKKIYAHFEHAVFWIPYPIPTSQLHAFGIINVIGVDLIRAVLETLLAVSEKQSIAKRSNILISKGKDDSLVLVDDTLGIIGIRSKNLKTAFQVAHLREI